MTDTPPSPDSGAAPDGERLFRPGSAEKHAADRDAAAPEMDPALIGPTVPDESSIPPVSAPRSPLAVARDIAKDAWPAAVVLALFTVAAIIVPTMTQVATTDDWAYTRSVEILLDEGTLKIFPVVAATAVGQVLWGALFGAVFGMSLGMMRVSTVVMVALGGIALYAILRQLGVSRGRSAVGMGVWLFNPLTYSLAFSFMTDAHFASVMLISLALYIRGLRPDRQDLRFVVAGSLVAGFAFLIRQQGALIPFAVGVSLLLTGRLWFRRDDLRRLLAIAGLPVATVIGYYIWLRWFNDVPEVQQKFLDEVRDAGWEGTWLLARRIPLYALFYAGLLVTPVLLAIAPWRRRAEVPRPMSGFMVYLGMGWVAGVLAALYLAGRRGQQMPFAPQFAGSAGLGPPDVLGSRQRLVESGSWVTTSLTVIAAIGAILLGVIVVRALGGVRTPERAGFWLVVMVGLWQLVGVFPPSYHYLNRGITLDRYLLPVIPIAIVAALWALRDIDLIQPLAWGLLAIVAVFSVAGARDYMVFMGGVWDMAEYANENGIANDRLDAGSAWDGYHLYTVMLDENITKARSPRGSPWWIYFYAKPTDSTYIVATESNVRRGYTVVTHTEIGQWLDDDPATVYLLRRWYAPFPVGDRDGGASGVPGIVEPLPGPPGISTPVSATPRAATPIAATPASHGAAD